MEEKVCGGCTKSKAVMHFGKHIALCLVCQRRANRRAKYAAYPALHREASKQFREKSPWYMRAYNTQYYAENKPQWIVYAKNRDPEKVRLASRAYREANREKVRAGVRDWFRRHPHVAGLAANRYRARLASVEDTLTAEQVAEILEFFDHRCGYCLVDLRTLPKSFRTLDHMLPLVRGGTNTPDNVIPSCKRCNSRKKDRHMALMVQYIEQAAA